MILVASTVAAYKCKDGDETGWIQSAEKMAAATEQPIEFFCAVQIGQGHDENLEVLRLRMAEIGGTIWEFSIHDGEPEVTARKRIRDICAGRNLCIEYAILRDASHILFLDSDLYVPNDSITKLLEIDHPVVGGDVPSYCLHGPLIEEGVPEDAQVQEHWNTAGFLLVPQEVFRVVRWRHDYDAGISDDPAFAQEVAAHGFGNEWVRHDLVGNHDSLVPVDRRGYDLTIT